MFQSIEKYCKTKYGYGSLKNVDRPDSVEDRMESFFLAETLKYLHLLFDPDSEIDILNKVRVKFEVFMSMIVTCFVRYQYLPHATSSTVLILWTTACIQHGSSPVKNIRC